jgi:hypothetical protein
LCSWIGWRTQALHDSNETKEFDSLWVFPRGWFFRSFVQFAALHVSTFIPQHRAKTSQVTLIRLTSARSLLTIPTTSQLLSSHFKSRCSSSSPTSTTRRISWKLDSCHFSSRLLSSLLLVRPGGHHGSESPLEQSEGPSCLCRR